jgi:protoporphyrinogen oxidase
MEKTQTIILGAGLCGLSTAFHLSEDYLLLEKKSKVGGLASTEVISGFLFDCTGHWLHIRNETVRSLVASLMPNAFDTIVRKAKIYLHGRMTDYPFQANLYGLRPQVLRECLRGAVEAALMREKIKKPVPKSFLDYVRFHFGEGIAKFFIIPYNTKIFGVHPSEITSEWTQRFVPVPDVFQIIDGALGFSNEAMGYNATFMYPKEGGIQALADAFLQRLDASRIMFNTSPSAISVKERFVEFGRERVKFDFLVSSIPLPQLVLLTVDAPEGIQSEARRLRSSPLRYMNVALKVEKPLGGVHWIYVPEAHFPFYRVGSASNVSRSVASRGFSSLYVELANDRIVGEREALSALSAFLKEIGTIRDDKEIEFAVFREYPYGYVLYDRYCARARRKIMDFYREHDIFCVGRYGGWQYGSMEDAIVDGMSVASSIRERG